MSAHPLILASLVLLAGSELDSIQAVLEHAFYPGLLFILVIASLGIPIPEDLPLIAAGVILRTHPGVASWPATLAVALVGIMSGDLILYQLGRRWGLDVVNHRSVRWMITPRRFAQVSEQFQRRGAWFCFFGRFVVGVRAVMCLTAGATRFPYWRFFLADFAGALLSIPLFVGLGYVFASMIPTLRAYLGGAQLGLLGAAVVGLLVVLMLYRSRRRRRHAALRAARRNRARKSERAAVTTAPGAPADDPSAISPRAHEPPACMPPAVSHESQDAHDSVTRN